MILSVHVPIYSILLFCSWLCGRWLAYRYSNSTCRHRTFFLQLCVQFLSIKSSNVIDRGLLLQVRFIQCQWHESVSFAFASRKRVVFNLVDNYPLSQGFTRRGAKRPPGQLLHPGFISIIDRRWFSLAEMSFSSSLKEIDGWKSGWAQGQRGYERATLSKICCCRRYLLLAVERSFANRFSRAYFFWPCQHLIKRGLCWRPCRSAKDTPRTRLEIMCDVTASQDSVCLLIQDHQRLIILWNLIKRGATCEGWSLNQSWSWLTQPWEKSAKTYRVLRKAIMYLKPGAAQCVPGLQAHNRSVKSRPTIWSSEVISETQRVFAFQSSRIKGGWGFETKSYCDLAAQ